MNPSFQDYHPPFSKDIPIDFRVTLLKDAPNPLGILGSKGKKEKLFIQLFRNTSSDIILPIIYESEKLVYVRAAMLLFVRSSFKDILYSASFVQDI